MPFNKHWLAIQVGLLYKSKCIVYGPQTSSAEGLVQWLAFGDFEQAAARVKQAGIPLVIMVRSVDEARKAAAVGADIVVAQVPTSNYLAALTSWNSLRYAGIMTLTTHKDVAALTSQNSLHYTSSMTLMTRANDGIHFLLTSILIAAIF